jgi:pyruvate/2-oxoglutarate dehydrogenase complex dihydrolipoamide acyltransferase (E2) component
MATLMTKSQFAKHINVKPGYVTQLQTAGRLVMEGNKVNVEASVARIEATRDPSKAGVAARHEKARAEKQQAETTPPDDRDEPEDETASGSDYQTAKALNEKYKALMAKTAYEREIKQLLPVDDVRQAVMDGDVLIRSRLESLPDMLAPQLAAETDEQRVRAILIEQIEQLMAELSSSFNKLVTS